MADTRSLDEKLVEFDGYAEQAVDELVRWLKAEGNDLIVQARGRLVRGHYAFGDAYMFELDQQRLLGEASEELADAINYIARRLVLLDG